jgi:hypothetical protein
LTYIRASWLLSQRAVVGDHLGQVYEKLGKKQEAIHRYKLALAAGSSDNEDLRKHYEALTGEKAGDADAPFLSRGSKAAFVPSPGEELSRMRMVNLTTASHETVSAVFDIVFSPGRVEEVKIVSGSDSLKTLSPKLETAKYKVEFPDSVPKRLNPPWHGGLQQDLRMRPGAAAPQQRAFRR